MYIIKLVSTYTNKCQILGLLMARRPKAQTVPQSAEELKRCLLFISMMRGVFCFYCYNIAHII